LTYKAQNDIIILSKGNRRKPERGNMEDMQMTEVARLIEGLRAAGWDEKKINDFLLYIETGKDEYKPTK
jgi:hypothetical protein